MKKNDILKNYSRKTKLDDLMHIVNLVDHDGIDPYYWISLRVSTPLRVLRAAERASIKHAVGRKENKMAIKMKEYDRWVRRNEAIRRETERRIRRASVRNV